ncbi:ATP-binding cassette domain-containing protein [Pseudactinotalea sp. Z1748]|uniref:ATP-binding cassette domain-containing protein n=1 Tax=Pseudactinotalea sp. Z1748 TaxID=3413027 RepID=UPI003C7B9218
MSHAKQKRTMSSAPAIEVTGLRKAYGTHTVLDGLDLRVDERIHALLGPNGAGKTTLINILSTLVPPDAGSVRILGRALPRDRRTVQRMISLTGQFAAVDELLSGTENMVMMGRLMGLSRADARTRGADLLHQFDLTEAASKAVSTYSGGMRRRLDLAISMICAPALLFLDEPTTGLDTRSRQGLWDQIRALAQAGTTVFLTTQYLEEADVLAERISVLDRGTIVAQGTPEELKSGVGGTVLQLRDDEGHLTSEFPTDGSVGHVTHILADLARSQPGARVSLRRPTMDEAFLHLTGAGPAPDPGAQADPADPGASGPTPGAPVPAGPRPGGDTPTRLQGAQR